MTVPEYLRSQASIAIALSDPHVVTLPELGMDMALGQMLREIAERWEKMDSALEDATLVARAQWAEVNNNPSSHRRDSFEFYQEALAAARAPLGEKP